MSLISAQLNHGTWGMVSFMKSWKNKWKKERKNLAKGFWKDWLAGALVGLIYICTPTDTHRHRRRHTQTQTDRQTYTPFLHAVQVQGLIS